MGRLKGFLTGGIIGAIAGLLLAPQKGEETRKKLQEEADKLNQNTKGLQETVKTKAQEIIGKVKELIK